MNESAGPLAGLRILDLTSVIMGPFATQILADYGADVIRIEPPGGEIMRKTGAMRSPGMGALYLQMNRNKRSVVLDLKEDAARAQLLRLCESADVFIHNVRPAAMARLRLSAPEVRAANPRLLYVSLLGYGEGGPYTGRPAYDDLIQGGVSLPWLYAQISGEEPRYVPATIADRVVGLNAVNAILAGLLARERSGNGMTIDVPMFETMAQFVLSDHMGGRTYEPPQGPAGYERLLTPNRRPFRTADGHVCVLIYNDKQWQNFFAAIGRMEEFESDSRLSDHNMRTRNYDYIYGRLAEIFLTRTSAEWLELLERNDIPCVGVRTLDDLIDDPHLAAVGFFDVLDDPDGGKIRYVGIPARFDGTRLHVRTHAPPLDEHAAEKGSTISREGG